MDILVTLNKIGISYQKDAIVIGKYKTSITLVFWKHYTTGCCHRGTKNENNKNEDLLHIFHKCCYL